MISIESVARDLAALRRQMDRLPAIIPAAQSSNDLLYQVVWGQLLPTLARQGIAYSASLVTGASLPDPGGGVDGQITAVPAFPYPTGLPNGVGVAQVVGSSKYVFVVHDGRTAAKPDAVAGELFVSAGTVNLDKVVGAKTYRYACVITPPNWW